MGFDLKRLYSILIGCISLMSTKGDVNWAITTLHIILRNILYIVYVLITH